MIMPMSAPTFREGDDVVDVEVLDDLHRGQLRLELTDERTLLKRHAVDLDGRTAGALGLHQMAVHSAASCRLGRHVTRHMSTFSRFINFSPRNLGIHAGEAEGFAR